jgi:hypothetical protein
MASHQKEADLCAGIVDLARHGAFVRDTPFPQWRQINCRKRVCSCHP